MRRPVLLLLALAALLGTSSAAGPSTEDKKKAIRMKSTPKLKEILADLGIEFDAAIGKEELRELVLQKDALTKWEEKHPDQKKVRAYCLATAWPPHVHVHVHPHPLPCALQAPSKARAAGGGGGSATAMGDMFFTMMDKDKDGQLSKEEVGKLAEMMAAMPGGPPAIPSPSPSPSPNPIATMVPGGPGSGGADGAGGAPPEMSSEQVDQFFKMMDGNGDGVASKAEVSAFMNQMMGMMGKSGASSPRGGGPAGMPGGMGGAGMGGGAALDEDEDDGRDEL